MDAPYQCVMTAQTDTALKQLRPEWEGTVLSTYSEVPLFLSRGYACQDWFLTSVVRNRAMDGHDARLNGLRGREKVE
jgi:hypothetical protein